MLSTSTHDTKRGEDARARINILSEVPREWRRQVRRWARLNRSKKRSVDDAAAPTANDEYLLYQTLLGSWPAELMDIDRLDADALATYRARIEGYMTKAIREAKAMSSWTKDRKRVVSGTRVSVSVDLSGRRVIEKKIKQRQ